jgi:hypothetical protein
MTDVTTLLWVAAEVMALRPAAGVGMRRQGLGLPLWVSATVGVLLQWQEMDGSE